MICEIASTMPDLIGSEKQIKWATELRKSILSKLTAGNIDISHIQKINTCRFWIDNRASEIRDIIVSADRILSCPIKWRKISVNIQNIECSTATSAKIKMPNNSRYSKLSFWCALKLLRTGLHSHEVLLSIKDDFIFSLKKYGNGEWNKKDIIKEVEITAEEMIAAFGGEVENAEQYTTKWQLQETAIDHVPKLIEPIDIQADESLKR